MSFINVKSRFTGCRTCMDEGFYTSVAGEVFGVSIEMQCRDCPEGAKWAEAVRVEAAAMLKKKKEGV